MEISVAFTEWASWNLGVLVFVEGGKPEYPEIKLLRAKTRINNKINPHMASTPGIEPGPHIK